MFNCWFYKMLTIAVIFPAIHNFITVPFLEIFLPIVTKILLFHCWVLVSCWCNRESLVCGDHGNHGCAPHGVCHTTEQALHCLQTIGHCSLVATHLWLCCADTALTGTPHFRQTTTVTTIIIQVTLAGWQQQAFFVQENHLEIWQCSCFNDFYSSTPHCCLFMKDMSMIKTWGNWNWKDFKTMAEGSSLKIHHTLYINQIWNKQSVFCCCLLYINLLLILLFMKVCPLLTAVILILVSI